MLLRLLLLFAIVATASADLTRVSDGRADASTELQQLIDSGVGHIDLPKGTYRLSKTLVIDLDKTGLTSIEGHGVARLVMAASGPALHFKGTHEGTAAPDSVKEGVFERQITPTVEGLQIFGAHEEADGVEATGTIQLTLSRVSITDCRHGVHLTVRNRNVIISACHIYKNSGVGVFYDEVNLHQSNIAGTHISYCKGGGVVSRGGNVRNLHIAASDIEGNMSPEAPPTANVFLDSTGGSIGEVAITGCTLQHSSKAPGCANIRIQGAGTDESLKKRTGIEFTREGNITIGNNVFSDVQMNVHVAEARGVTITGNTFWEGFQHDLLVERSAHVVVTGNNFDRNPRYAVNGFDAAENDGVVFVKCDDCSFVSNVMSGVMRKRAALDVRESARMNVTQNQVLDSDGAGILLENVRRSLLSDNIVRDDRSDEVRSKEPSLHVIGGSDNLIGSNVLSNGKKIE